MNTMTERNRLAGKLRRAALAAALAGVAVGAVAVPALAQESVTTTRTVRTYDYGYYPDYYPSGTTTYYNWGPAYDYGYDYPPPPAYTYYGAPAPGVTVGVPGLVGIHLGP
jgi:hypothetical protein